MKSILVAGLIMTILAGSGCSRGADFDTRLNPVVAPYRFSIVGWEWQTAVVQVKQWYYGRQVQSDDGVRRVTEYYDAVKRIRTLQSEIAAANSKNSESAPFQLEYELQGLQKKQALQAPVVEKVITEQIRRTLAEQGIYNPVIDKQISFPPLNFKLEELPSVLVISPREKIESMREVVLEQNLTLKQKEALEASADNLGVSSLVVAIGGMATYPSLVDSSGSLQSAINTATHEWLHQYLAFTPLGFRYILDLTGISRNYDIATMNESLAGMLGNEIGALVYKKYYPGYPDGTAPTTGTGFDFNSEMREIRKAVDVYLARGEVQQAEEFMEQKRQGLAARGYYIRKLNQAYFAFNGTYADTPAFLNPIGLELKELRARSASAKEFLGKVAGMTSPQDLSQSVR